MNNYDVAAVLRAEGCTVVEEDGWRTRGYDAMTPEGFVVHHTATGKDVSRDAMRRLLVTKGRPDLPAPLCNLWLRRDGTVHVVAKERANHAGPGSGAVFRAMKAGKPLPKPGKDDTHGNRHLIGIECENDGQGEGWSQAQMDALVRCAVAICRAQGWEASRVIAHKEWTSRKIDPRGINMDSLRVVVGERLRGPARAQAGAAPAGVTHHGEATWEVEAVNSLPTLAKGAGGGGRPNPFVARMQGLLIAGNQSKQTVTGVFDAATETQLKAWQRRAKIVPDGICGRGTWTKLLGL